MMIGGRIFRKLQVALDYPSLGIRSSIDNPGQTRLDDSAKTHGTRFEGNVQGATGKTVIVAFLSAKPQGKNFGMGGWIAGVDGRIVYPRNRRALRIQEHRTNRHFAQTHCLAGQIQGSAHPMEIDGAVSRGRERNRFHECSLAIFLAATKNEQVL
jgi:hypothetical protein